MDEETTVKKSLASYLATKQDALDKTIRKDSDSFSPESQPRSPDFFNSSFGRSVKKAPPSNLPSSDALPKPTAPPVFNEPVPSRQIDPQKKEMPEWKPLVAQENPKEYEQVTKIKTSTPSNFSTGNLSDVNKAKPEKIFTPSGFGSASPFGASRSKEMNSFDFLSKTPKKNSFPPPSSPALGKGFFDSGNLKNVSQKPTPVQGEDKKLRKIIVLGVLLTVLVVGGAGIYYYLTFVKNKPSAVTPPLTEIEETSQAQSLAQKAGSNQFRLNPDTLITLDAPDLEKLAIEIAAYRINDTVGLKQLFLTINSQEITLSQLKSLLNINIPLSLIGTSQKFAFFMSKGSYAPTVGLAIGNTASPDLTKEQMQEWEKTMVSDLTPLFFGKPIDEAANLENPLFKDSSKIPNARFLMINQAENISIDYAVMADKIIITTSYPALEAIKNLPF